MFKQIEKSKENSPDFTGKGMFEGVEVRLSGWAKKSKDGKVYLQGTIQRPQNSAAPATQAEVDDLLGDPLSDYSPAPSDTSRQPATMLPGADSLPF